MLPRGVILRNLRHGGPGLVSGLVAVNAALGVLPVAFVVASSVLIGRVPAAVAGGVSSAAWDDLVLSFLAAAGAFVGQQILTPLQGTLGELLRRRVDGWVHGRLLDASLRSTGIGPLEDQDVLNALAEATRWLHTGHQTPGTACAGMLALLSRYLRLAGFLTIVGVVYSWLAAAVLLGMVMLFRYGQQGGHRRYSRVWRQVMPKIRHGEYLRGIGIGAPAAKEVRIFGLNGWVSERYQAAYHSWLAVIWHARRRIYLYPYLVYTTVGQVVSTVVLVMLARSAAGGATSLTSLALGLQAVTAALMLGNHYAEADLQTTFGVRTAMALSRFEALVDARDAAVPSAHRDGAAMVDPTGMPTREVRLDSLSFAYPGSSRAVLDGLDLRLPAGRCTAVVGVNGAGKTTLVKLLTRLYEPTGGSITVDGVDIRAIDVDAWRRQVSVIFQDFIRYELPAADNIALGAVQAPPDEAALRRAAELAGILDVLDALPRGLSSPLSRAYAGGADLSGGQWQRVAIARSLYALQAGAKVLVLDEPTAALDVRAEAEFFDHFVDLTRGVTSLLISHRFSSVRRADRIVVIDGGRAVEEGTHDELMTVDGHYARLFRLQAERFAAGLGAEEHIGGGGVR